MRTSTDFGNYYPINLENVRNNTTFMSRNEAIS